MELSGRGQLSMRNICSPCDFKVAPYNFLILANMEFRYVFLDNYYSSKNNECMFSIGMV